MTGKRHMYEGKITGIEEVLMGMDADVMLNSAYQQLWKSGYTALLEYLRSQPEWIQIQDEKPTQANSLMRYTALTSNGIVVQVSASANLCEPIPSTRVNAARVHLVSYSNPVESLRDSLVGVIKEAVRNELQAMRSC